MFAELSEHSALSGTCGQSIICQTTLKIRKNIRLCDLVKKPLRITAAGNFIHPFAVIFNTVIVGLELSYFINSGEIFKEIWVFFSSIATSEALVCFILGTPLYFGLKKTKIFER